MASVKKAALGLLAVGGLAAMCSGPKVPPHLERIEYLEQHLTGLYMKVNSRFYNDALFVYDDGRSTSEGEPSPDTRMGTIYVMLVRSNGKKPLDYYMLSVRDTPLHGNDGDVDKAVIYRINDRGGEDWSCDLWRHEIPDEDLLNRLDRHYERSTEAAYLAITEGKDSYRPIIGVGEWHKLSELCGH